MAYNKHRDIQPEPTSSRAIAHDPRTAGASRRAVPPAQGTETRSGAASPAQLSAAEKGAVAERKNGHPAVKPFQLNSGGKKGVVQRFPYTAEHNTKSWMFFVKFAGDTITLSMGPVYIGHLQIKVVGKEWGVKNIVTEDAFRGQGLGEMLVYFFADMAVRAGATSVVALTASGTGLWKNTGFTVTQLGGKAIDVKGDPGVVLSTARSRTLGRYTITQGIAPGQAPNLPQLPELQVPGVKRAPGKKTSSSTEGNPQIKNEDL